MARGDIVNVMFTNVPAGSYVTYQPAQGYQYLVLGYGIGELGGTAPNYYLPITIGLYDGASFPYIVCPYTTNNSPRQKFGITNSVYLYMVNSSSVTRSMVISMVQVNPV